MEGKKIAEIPTPTTGYTGSSSDRPLGVTIIVILEVLGALAYLFTGAMAILAGAMVGSIIPGLGAFAVAIGAIVLIFGILYLLLAWGLWTLKSWAWMAAVILNIIGLILGILQFNWIGVIISLIIVIYLQQGDIKSRFR
ncbi:MAG: hypothetical protein EAX87_00040 [Candidatus Thorarchaeota archaeon]|nr:hypothetical protein [Candidatus Thorarchaeota archaeon]